MALEKEFPTAYFSKYSMVTFNDDIPYNEAMKKGRAQDKALLNMIADNEIDTNSLDLKTLLLKVNKETEHILDEDNIAKTMKH